MKIVIATGIYPPAIGGPAQYAKELAEAFRGRGKEVRVLAYGLEKYLPTGVRHLWFFLRAFFAFASADLIIAFDTFSVGLPSVAAAKILGKKIIIRTGGDFLWEGFVERTGNLVLFRDFYRTCLYKLNAKEKIIFLLTKWTIRNASAIVFSTKWQKEIWREPYALVEMKCRVIENFYALPLNKPRSWLNEEKVFIAGTRNLKWKNIALLRRAFALAKARRPELVLDLETATYEKFQEKIRNAHAVILVSLGDISPNMILDAIRAGMTFILTRECGILDRVAEHAVLVDPKDEREIAEKILWLADEKNYREQLEKLASFKFSHSWNEISEEFLAVLEK